MDYHSQKPNVICMIGMHRSGTSMIARLLERCGLYLGPADQLVGPDVGNPLGHFEHVGFHEIDDALLEHLGGSWHTPPPLNAEWEHDASLEGIRQRSKALLQTFSGRSLWGWKDPRTTILLPFWMSLIPGLRFVICVRSPLEVARSLEKRDGMSIGAGAYLWKRYMRAAIVYTEKYPRIFTFYEDFFRNPLDEISRLVKFCGLEMVRDSHLKTAISGELRHHASETLELLQTRDIPTEQKLFYVCLRALSCQGFAAEMPGTRPSDESAANVGQLVQLIDEFHDQEKIAQLQEILTAKDLQVSSVEVNLRQELKKREQEITQKEQEITQLEQQNARLQGFADAVRGTLAYRFYRQFVRPFKS